MNDNHIDNDTFDRCQLQIKAGSASSKCKFEERVKCEIEVNKTQRAWRRLALFGALRSKT